VDPVLRHVILVRHKLGTHCYCRLQVLYGKLFYNFWKENVLKVKLYVIAMNLAFIKH
jgi:hypothetical protein